MDFNWPVDDYVVWHDDDSATLIVGATRRAGPTEAVLAVWQHARCRLPLSHLRAESRAAAGEMAWRVAVEANKHLPGAYEAK